MNDLTLIALLIILCVGGTSISIITIVDSYKTKKMFRNLFEHNDVNAKAIAKIQELKSRYK